ncbi:MAG: hypothetical protein M3Y41_10375 [Pseudomonadota bacterium]|nr:hypothetical protein [Pseudomonadota bacterium]
MIRTYQERVTETIIRSGGFIAHYMGDGVLVYFGWPKAGEADAEQSVRAALLTLSRLDRIDATSLAVQLTTRPVLSPTLLERIVAQSDGVPLFIEELTKAVMETAPHAAPEAAAVTVPATLQASLLARLDRMPAAKQVAQIGAVFGRDFTHAMISAVADLPAALLNAGLDQLVTSDHLLRRGEAPEASYTFKHALVRDAAYDMPLRNRRQGLHAA